MKYLIASIAILLTLLIACRNKNSNGVLSTPGELLADSYTIQVDRDTTLVTKNGAFLKIDKGTLLVEQGSTATIEIKEAYSISKMVLAGLITEADGQPLSSGGMIYINAVAGQQIKIQKPISVSVPTDYLDKNMQLYKGVQRKDGTENWVNPTPLPPNQQLNTIQKGGILFQQKCSSCHAIGKDMTGPDLAHFEKRFPRGEGSDWLYRSPHSLDFRAVTITREVSDSLTDTGKNESTHSGDFFSYYDYWQSTYFCNLQALFGSVGPIQSLKDVEINEIADYIKNESRKGQLPLPSHAYLNDCVDSCENYSYQKRLLEEKKAGIAYERQRLIKENGKGVKEEEMSGARRTTPSNGTTGTPAPDSNSLPDQNEYHPVYYQFTITSFGWYNVDVLIENTDGVKTSSLFVRIAGEYRKQINLYLIIPSRKIYLHGSSIDDNEIIFAFKQIDGKILLPQNTKAYILALTEANTSVAFGIKEFTTTISQELELSLNLSTKEQFAEAINAIDLQGLEIKVADTKNASQIRTEDINLKNIEIELQKAEKLKPKNCDCQCGDRSI